MITRSAPLKRTRVQPIRSKPRRGRVRDKAFMEFVATTKDCILVGKHLCHPWITLHHVKECPGAPKNDRRVIRLCANGHLHAFHKESIEHGRVKWEQRWGIDLEAVIVAQNAEYEVNLDANRNLQKCQICA